jgi:hypothetical protein
MKFSITYTVLAAHRSRILIRMSGGNAEIKLNPYFFTSVLFQLSGDGNNLQSDLL